jgi:nucleoside-diphosphate-sugar epimerase
MTFNKTTVLVTGATGFLGRNILKALIKQSDIEVIAACRDNTRLPAFFQGKIREGDLRNASYRRSVVQGVDIICHTGTWAAMWNHAAEEVSNFYQPTADLIDQAIYCGVSRFIMTSTVAISSSRDAHEPLDDFSPPMYTGFWPHLNRLIDIDNYMQANAHLGMQMITMRLGHFIGAGNTLGFVPALVPRLKSHLVPWLSGGRSRLPLITDEDLGRAFVAACMADSLNNYESFNICGLSFPTTREVIDYIVKASDLPAPHYSVPYRLAYMFAWLMESMFPLLPGKAPFLTRSIVHLAEHRTCTTAYAENKLGYYPTKPWQTALDEALAELKALDYPWQELSQRLS